MQIGLVGLGRMGAGIVRRLLRDGHDVAGYDRGRASIDELARDGMKAAYSLQELVNTLDKPRAVWLMIPSGQPVTDAITELQPMLEPGDCVIDGGNSYYKDSIARAEQLRRSDVDFLDVGTSGGIWGLTVGFCLMIGGERRVFERLEPIFKTLAPVDGYGYMGGAGAGHYVKMVHNGIEYGMLQAYGEGFEILNSSDFGLDLGAISKLWNQGSVVRSWLLELAEEAFAKDPGLSDIRGWVADSGEGRWTIQEAMNRDIPAPVITLSLLARFASRQSESFSAKVIAALRNEFGGHAVKKQGE